VANRIAKQERLIVRLYWCGYKELVPAAIELLRILEQSQQAALLHLQIIKANESFSVGAV